MTGEVPLNTPEAPFAQATYRSLDLLCGRPPSALLLIEAAQNPDKEWRPPQLADALLAHGAENPAPVKSLNTGQRALIVKTCKKLFDHFGMFSPVEEDAGDGARTAYRLRSDDLELNLAMACTVLEWELNNPDTALSDRFSHAYAFDKPSAPSANLAIFWHILQSPTGDVELTTLKRLGIKHNGTALHSHLQQMTETGILKRSSAGNNTLFSIPEGHLQGVRSFVEAIEQLNDPEAIQRAAARARSLLDQETIRQLIAKHLLAKKEEVDLEALNLKWHPTYPARWAGSAACREATQAKILNVDDQSSAAEIAAAKAVCAGCDVNVPCAAEALREGESDGVWGGMTDKERRLLIPQQRQRFLGIRVVDAATS